MTNAQSAILAELQKGFPITPRPFLALAQAAGCTEEEALTIVQNFVADGTIRKFGGFLNHYLAGFSANAMVVWDVDETRVVELGKRMSRYKNVSHCYARPKSKAWPYHLYTMIHGKTRDGVEKQAREMSEKEGIKNFKVLFSVKEYKKVNRWLGRE